MKYRVLKNDDHYVIQRKRWFGWEYLRYIDTTWSTVYQDYCYFKGSIKNEAKFYDIDKIKQILEIIKKDESKKARLHSKYKPVPLPEETPLYKILNEDEDNLA